MMRLQLVTTSDEEVSRTIATESTFLHGTNVLKRLVLPWAATGRIVCADSYFASVETAEALLDIGLKFIDVVKTATRKFPMANLSVREMTERGDSISLVHKGQDGCVRLMGPGVGG